MSDPSSTEEYVIDIEYTDAGMRLIMDMDEWAEKVSEDFGTFESINDFYRKPIGDLIDDFEQGMKEVDSDDTSDEPGILIRNIPKEWQEDQSELAEILGLIHQQLVRLGLGDLIYDELEAEEDFLENDLYKPLLIRQSAFYEDFLKMRSLLRLQEEKGDTLSTREFEIVDRMGHRDRIRFAHLFGILDEEEHGVLQQMASFRNDLAHSAWPEFSSQEEAQIKSIAEQVNEMLSEELADGDLNSGLDHDEIVSPDSGIGFEQLGTKLQLLQLSIADIVREQGGTTTVEYIKNGLVNPNENIEQRILRMKHIGYIQLEDDTVQLTEQGEQLLEDYWY
ncbi:hypothetical protein [Halorubrum sp. DM2]|uniref:hypothetical protein n=1 Tax=Halorubrum sp. DM2 TaxID=2527867 RepID=UPI0024B768F6|nr:hypothetical protein [Halorubrum sp. DM2]